MTGPTTPPEPANPPEPSDPPEPANPPAPAVPAGAVPWTELRRFTPARVALGRVGNALPTAAHLAFQADHAAARDAVGAELDVDALVADLAVIGLPSVVVRSGCPDRRSYLLHPDRGRRLADGEAERLPSRPGAVVFVVCDGLSAAAPQRHATPLLARVAPALGESGPVVVARQGRVALGDAVGAAMGAAAVVVLIGERPGLTTPASLGVYLTADPRPGRTDAERNCISNIHDGGLSIDAAATKLLWLIGAMRRLGRTGVDLKDEQPDAPGIGSGTDGMPPPLGGAA